VKEMESGDYRDTSLKVTAALAQLYVELGKK
jgi:hypothetical protein